MMKTAVIDVRLTEARFSQGFYVVAIIDNSCGKKEGEEGGSGESKDSPSDPGVVSKQMRVMVKPMEHDIGEISCFLDMQAHSGSLVKEDSDIQVKCWLWVE